MVCWVRQAGQHDNQAKVPIVLVGCVVGTVGTGARVW